MRSSSTTAAECSSSRGRATRFRPGWICANSSAPGIPFDGKKAAEMGLVNEAVPKSQLRARTAELAKLLLGKNPNTLRACKQAVRAVQGMPYELSADYLAAKSAQLEFYDDEKGRNEGLTQFLDEKSYRPGLGTMRRKKHSG